MEKLDNLIIKLKERAETHPNLANIWCRYIEIKKEKFELLIDQGEKLLILMDNMSDLSLDTVMMLMLFKQEMDTLNNT